MRVLVACEYSGTVRDAFLQAGHDAMSCDLLSTDVPGPHWQGDVLDILNDGWDLMIAHPPCTYLCKAGVWCLHRDPERWHQLDEAAAFFRMLLDAPIPRKAIENPRMHGYAYERIGGRRPDQTIQPHQFGHDASKATCLWLHNLPPLMTTCHVAPRMVNGLRRWANQTDSGQNRLGPSPDRWKLRSATYPGIAAAMAAQWGALEIERAA